MPINFYAIFLPKQANSQESKLILKPHIFHFGSQNIIEDLV